ncbi:MAG: amidotransferase [Candidatus Melainabacteria bacterium]|nr:MAG: amidotransferase [Candidatus Melainabacteria bacterium]
MTENENEEDGIKVQVLQHVSFEAPFNIETWAREKGFKVAKTYLFDEPLRLPQVNNFDYLVIMGGPMGANDDKKFPWLTQEKKLIEGAIAAQKKVLGVCLGAQLVAQALGASVSTSPHKEIGWFPIESVNGGTTLNGLIPSPLLVLHWHADSFELPQGAKRLARSSVCENQAFIWSERVLGLQFHLEVQPEHVRDFVAHCRKELTEGGPFVQRAESILAESGKALAMRPVLDKVLDSFFTPAK